MITLLVELALFMIFLFGLYFTIMVQINKVFDEALTELFQEGELQELAWSGLHDKK
tara:strand:- start:4093 stop:4260 length:168 start_codon:yes stop_codon:yes gene_type:complete